MVWIIVWAGLLIVVLYSPVGSPDFYSSQNFYVVNQPVSVSKGTTVNTPKATNASENNSGESGIPDINSDLTSNHPVGNYKSGNASTGGSSYGIMQTQSYQNTNAGSDGMAGGSSFIASRGSRNSEGTSGISMTNGITTLSISSGLNTATSRQGAKAGDPQTGGTDPGGDPDGPAIPVGDGWGILVLFGAVYIILKKKKHFLKARNTSH